MNRILVSWIGQTDLNAARGNDSANLGPVAGALSERVFDRAVLLCNYPEDRLEEYLSWLVGRCGEKLKIDPKPVSLSNPTDYTEIYEAVTPVLHKLAETSGDGADLTFHLSPGTPAMATVWILLASTKFPARLIQSSRERGVVDARLPFDIAAEFIPEMLRERDTRLRDLSSADPPEAPEFSDIIHRSPVMERLIRRARRVALRNIPVLIEGESGTGKELLARAIHRVSPRREAPFVPVNCGAIPDDLFESELFGREKGAFTGASDRRKGYFEAADGGTLFLDELAELPGPAQIKLLRAVQEGEIVRLGSTKAITVDVRIIAATNRILTGEIAAGRFREDLFYRLAVAVLKIPPLRDRPGDLSLLIEHLFDLVNGETDAETGDGHKKLSVGARNLLLRHPWPGNVRELLNTLRRAVIWSDGSVITAEDVRESLLPAPGGCGAGILEKSLGGGFSLPDVLSEVSRHYLSRALDESGGNKTRAAELLGLPSYQTLSNWLRKYGVEK